MTKSDIADRLRAALAKELKRDAASIEPRHKLRDDLGLNSLDAIELIFKIEEEFDLSIPDEDVMKLATVGDMLDYLDRRLNQGASSPGPSSSAASAQPATPAAPRAVAAKKAPGKPPAKAPAKTSARRKHA